MQNVSNFLIDPLVWPLYIYFAAYSFVWLFAFVLARLFMNQTNIERAAILAWRIGIVLHLLSGIVLVIWLYHSNSGRSDEQADILFYLIPYLIIIVVDVCLLLLSIQSGKTSRAAARSPKRSTRSLNPKSRS